MDLVDQHPFVVALHGPQIEAVLGGGRGGQLLDVGQRDGAVQLGFTAAEQVQVGAVDEEQPAPICHVRTVPTRMPRWAASRTGALSAP